MRIFERFNQNGPECPVCKTHENRRSILIEIDGTCETSMGCCAGISEATLAHLDCVIEKMRHNKDVGLFYVKV